MVNAMTPVQASSAPYLTEEQISSGKLLLEALDRSGMAIKSAFWFYRPEALDWKLGISAAHRVSPREFYTRIQRIMGLLPENRLSLEHLAVFRPDAPLVRLLRDVIRVDQANGGVRLSGNVVNGVRLPDMVVYRS